ncbi:sensor histidine kinase [Sphingomonas fennica]|uniref:histidine kinase n=1 Tax=Edaphosphingomonas fennica TaxID=114404 RepID=A0A2T4HPQ4_9SPHN|nr:PAS domain-containing protein [Sphingomonas fennica]PTD17784.1 PAS domain S-box protein [Sphingomonas fennica]
MCIGSDEWWNESSDNLRAIIENAPRKMWVGRPDGTAKFYNREWRRYTGDIETTPDHGWRDLVHPTDLHRLRRIAAPAIAAGQRYDVEMRLKRQRDGAYRWHRASVAPVEREGRLIAWVGAAADIDDRRRAEIALRESEGNFRLLANVIPQLAWMRDMRDGTVWYNDQWSEFTGLPGDEIVRSGWRATVHPDQIDELNRIIDDAHGRREPWEFTCRLRSRDGDYLWFLIRAVPILEDGAVAVRRWFATATDIHRQYELQERQKLLTKEVSHRVKNSLSLVASILDVKARSSRNEIIRDVLLDARSRVQTIADVHDHLWKQEDARVADLGEFLRDLCRKLGDSAPHHSIAFEGFRHIVPAEQAISIGLVVNELVTNALKYAYPADQGGPIRVILGKGDEGHITIEVADEGVGLPEDFDLSRPGQSLGMKLIARTTKQLKADASVARLEKGTRFAIQVPKTS